MRRLILFIPLILMAGLGVFLYKGLFLNPQAMPSALEGKPMPAFTKTTVMEAGRTVTLDDLEGEIYLVNVWGTWCPSCKVEHPFLLNLARQGEFPIYGVNYDDQRADSVKWLEKYKSPYKFTIFDDDGSLAVDLGVFGAPETFVVDHNGVIRLRFAGVLEPRVWQSKFLPLIETIRAEKRAEGAS